MNLYKIINKVIGIAFLNGRVYLPPAPPSGFRHRLRQPTQSSRLSLLLYLDHLLIIKMMILTIAHKYALFQHSKCCIIYPCEFQTVQKKRTPSLQDSLFLFFQNFTIIPIIKSQINNVNYNNEIYILRRLNKYMLLVNHKKTDNDIYISHRINIYQYNTTKQKRQPTWLPKNMSEINSINHITSLIVYHENNLLTRVKSISFSNHIILISYIVFFFKIQVICH